MGQMQSSSELKHKVGFARAMFPSELLYDRLVRSGGMWEWISGAKHRNWYWRQYC